MAEDESLCTHYNYHKHKLILFLAAMRSYRDELQENGFEVAYTALDSEEASPSFFQALKDILEKQSVSRIRMFEIEDKFFEKKVKDFCEEEEITLDVLESPSFLCSRERFAEYLESASKPFMKTFYEQQRRRLDILIDSEGNPEGGKFSFDEENRKKLPKKLSPPPLPEEESNSYVSEVSSLVNTRFPEHPGSVEGFWLPVDRTRALYWLRDFFENRFKNFGPYEDAITPRSDSVYHSTLSPMINLGLLTPEEVVQRALDVAKETDVPLPSLEGFIRQVIGWREFVRGIYQNFSETQEKENFWGHERLLASCWYSADTGIPPLDDALEKTLRLGWNHHIERLMIIGNVMLLCEIAPREVHRWFMEMYVDSSDWVMGPNIYGMSQFSDGGIFATKPYICGSNYIRKMSSYPKGEWCDVLDGLYWRFIGKHRDFYESNPRMSMMSSLLDKIEDSRKERIFSAAEKFIAQVSSKPS